MTATCEMENRIAESLRNTLQTDSAPVIIDMTDLSPSLSPSKIFRVRFVENDVLKSLILKIPDWGSASMLDEDDVNIQLRERLFFESFLPGVLPNNISTPPLLGIDCVDDQTLIWMHDERKCFERFWNKECSVSASRTAARLPDVYEAHEDRINSFLWLRQRPHRVFHKHLPEAGRNVSRLAAEPNGELLDRRHIELAQAALEVQEWAMAELDDVPQTFSHGDFHPANIGWKSDGRMVLVDWCNVGLGQLGSDLAMLISLHRVFGNNEQSRDPEFERRLTLIYVNALRIPNAPKLIDIERTVWLWFLTWGLHLRLGPALTALLENRVSSSNKRQNILEDIVDGIECVAESKNRFSSAF